MQSQRNINVSLRFDLYIKRHDIYYYLLLQIICLFILYLKYLDNQFKPTQISSIQFMTEYLKHTGYDIYSGKHFCTTLSSSPTQEAGAAHKSTYILLSMGRDRFTSGGRALTAILYIPVSTML